MNPDFHVNMNLGEFSEFKRREIEIERQKKLREAERRFMFFAAKFLVPFFLIWIGYVLVGIEGKFSLGILLVVSGVIYLSLSIYYFLLRDYFKNKKYYETKVNKKQHYKGKHYYKRNYKKKRR